MSSENTRPALWLASALVLVTALRLWLMPTQITAPNFGHDSAYVARLAENLVAGNGYVNDAHWLVFLAPDRLPMPYHNANPLYPTLIAAVSAMTGLTVITAGFAINTVAHGLLVVALVLLLQPWVPSLGRRSLLAVAVAFFPPIFEGSLCYLPDLLCLVFLVAAFACVVRNSTNEAIVRAGLLFGLAWLTRSSASLLVPLFAVVLLGRDGWRLGLWRGLLLGLTALLVVSPWLWHTYAIWGSPFRSDAAYYWLQDYHARHFDNDVDRYWHSTDVPPSLGQVLAKEPGSFLAFYAGSVPLLVRHAVAGWSDGRLWLAGLIGILALVTSVRLGLRYRQATERPTWALPVLASLVTVVINVAIFAPRASTLEMRYLDPLSVLLALLLLYGLFVRTSGWASRVILFLGLAFWFVWVPYQDIQRTRSLLTPIPERVAFLDYARWLDGIGTVGPVVVGDSPYFYTLVTRSPALSIPQSDDEYLLTYMKRYGARFILLTPKELAFWRPTWAEAPPAWLVRRHYLDDGVLLFELKEGS